MRLYSRVALTAALVLLSACTPGPTAAGSRAPTVLPTIEIALPPAWTSTPSQAAPSAPLPQAPPPPTEVQETKSTESRALQQKDLPGGFSPVALITYHLNPTALGGGSLTPLAFSAFGHNGDDTLVLSATFALTDSVAQQGFNAFLQSPQSLLGGLAVTMGTIQRPPAAVPGMSTIGDRSAAARASAQIQGAGRDLELVIFSTGPIGGYVLVATRQGKNPAVSLQSAAESLLDAQMPTPTPEPATPSPAA